MSAPMQVLGRDSSSKTPSSSVVSSNNSLPGRSAFSNNPSFPTTHLKGPAPYSTHVATTGEPIVHDAFESKTGSWQYIVADPTSSTAIIIDPVLDYDPATGNVTTETADSLLLMATDMGYNIKMILETHAHADHITAASYLKKRLGQMQHNSPLIGIGRRIVQVQQTFSPRYNVPSAEYEGAFDKLFNDDETFHIGNLTATAIHLPGHTPDHLGYKIGDNIFVGDSIFHIDLGSARADFPGGSAETLFSSGRKVLSLPDHVKIWIGHDYPPEGRTAPVPWMTVREHREQNKHLKDGITKEDFVALRHQRDAMLAEPRLLHQSLQMNIRAGRLPPQEDSGLRLIHLPLKLKSVEW